MGYSQEIGDRLRVFRKYLNKNQTELADILGVAQTTLSKYEVGTADIADNIKIILSGKGLNIHWLLTGEGSMFLEKESDGTVNDAPCQLDGIRLKGSKTIPVVLDGSKGDIVFVPFYRDQAASAGSGREIEEYQDIAPIPIIKSFLSPYNPVKVRALEVKGDSMTRIGLFDKDIVFFIEDETEGDGVFVISTGGRLLVKRLEFDPLGKELRVISENDRYQPRILKNEEILEIKIEGKVIGWLHRHPY